MKRDRNITLRLRWIDSVLDGLAGARAGCAADWAAKTSEAVNPANGIDAAVAASADLARNCRRLNRNFEGLIVRSSPDTLLLVDTTRSPQEMPPN